MNIKETVKTETLEAEANQIWEDIIVLERELKELHCPDYCSGSGLCGYCAVEQDLAVLDDEYGSVLRELRRRAAPGW